MSTMLRILRVSALVLVFLAYSAAEEVYYSNPNAPGVKLAATFTRPAGSDLVPAVLLIPGAGPQDRDETVAGHKFLKELGDFLNAHNIAVLRADDRGVGKSTGDFQSATTSDFASDARAGVEYLKTRRDIDARQIGLVGHGEGAIVAAILAAQNSEIRFIVLLSGTAVTGQKVLLAQTARAEEAADVPPEQIEADLRLGNGLYRLAMEGRSEDDMRQALEAVPSSYKPFIDPWLRQLPRLQSPWLRSFLAYDPSTALEQVKCPVLALFGERDMTIDPDQNASAMKRAFSKGHNREAKVKILPGLNYLFQKAKTGLPTEYQTIREGISPQVLQEIQDFVAKQTGADPRNSAAGR